MNEADKQDVDLVMSFIFDAAPVLATPMEATEPSAQPMEATEPSAQPQVPCSPTDIRLNGAKAKANRKKMQTTKHVVARL